MLWYAAAAAGSKALSGLSSNAEQAIGLARQSVGINQGIVRANVENSIRTAYRVGLLNMQRAVEKQQQAQLGLETSAAALRATGTAEANAAASGTIGASVDAVIGDIHQKYGEALADQEQDWQIKTTNYNTNLDEIIMSGKAAVRDAYKVDIPSYDSMFKNALTSGVIDFAGQLAMSKMNLGLGNAEPGNAGPLQVPAGGLNTGGAQGFSLSTPSQFGYNFNLGNNSSWSRL